MTTNLARLVTAVSSVVGTMATASGTTSKLFEAYGPRVSLHGANDNAVAQRHLQSSCSSDAFTVTIAPYEGSPTSAGFYSSRSNADLGGCYQDTGIALGGYPYYTPSGLDTTGTYVAAFDISLGIRWALADHVSSFIWCQSEELADNVHPGEATWSCDADAIISSSENIYATSECGGTCEDSAPGEETCTSDTVYISSTAYPQFEGCYTPTGVLGGGEPIYSVSGQVVEGEPLLVFTEAIFTSTSTTSEEGSGQFFWLLGLSEDSILSYSCNTLPYATSVHPADASWSCDINGDSVISHVPSETADTPGLFEVSCGDASASCAATTSAGSTPTSTTDYSVDGGATTDSSTTLGRGDTADEDDGNSTGNDAADEVDDNQEDDVDDPTPSPAEGDSDAPSSPTLNVDDPTPSPAEGDSDAPSSPTSNVDDPTPSPAEGDSDAPSSPTPNPQRAPQTGSTIGSSNGARHMATAPGYILSAVFMGGWVVASSLMVVFLAI